MGNLASTSDRRLTEHGTDDDPGDGGEPAAEPGTIQIEVTVDPTVDTSAIDLPTDGWFERSLSQLAGLAGATGGAIGVNIVGDERMARLHEQYKAVPGTTDVLTFDLRQPVGPGDGDMAGVVDVDLVVCIDEARRQAEGRGHPVRLELLLYALHGVLHVLGYDDLDEASAARMHLREDALLVEAGFGEVYGHRQ